VRPGSEHDLKGFASIDRVPGDVLEPDGLAASIEGCAAIVHLVGIIREQPSRGVTFERLHAQATRNMLELARKAGVPRYVQMSALGTRPGARARYHRTKWEAEEAVRASGLDWTIFRPSIIFGPGDGFVSLLAPIVRGNPVFVPVIGNGLTKFQPVSIHDVARVFAASLGRPETVRQAYEVGGPEVLTLNAVYREIAAAVGKPGKPLVHLPLWYGRLLAALFEWLARRGLFRHPPLTRDQLRSLSRDNAADTSATVAAFGGDWRRFGPGIREYLTTGRHDPRNGIGRDVELERRALLRVR
jgi:NADH dehydrogenase